jgi:hypothetical protein
MPPGTRAQESQPAADPAHLRYRQAIRLPENASGQACVVLDSDIYAHAAHASARDLRLFAEGPSGVAREAPFAISESATEPVETQWVAAQNVVAHGSDLSFDLTMPRRPYSAVDLTLGGPAFIAVAEVQGLREAGGAPTDLGRFVLFDLTERHLTRFTTLSLAEASFPRLHVTLHLTTPEGEPMRTVTPQMIGGAAVPPSREAQVLYTPVARVELPPEVSGATETVVRFREVPAHLPVERVRFTLRPGAVANFARSVTIASQPLAGTGPLGTEEMQGTISQIVLPGRGLTPAIRFQQLELPATLGSTLATPAQVTVTVHHGAEGPLPLASVELEMRRRTLCFEAATGSRYTLYEGDPALGAPAYEFARGFVASPAAIPAELGAAELNPAFVPRRVEGSYFARHPDARWVVWLGLIFAVILGTLESVKRQRHR